MLNELQFLNGDGRERCGNAAGLVLEFRCILSRPAGNSNVGVIYDCARGAGDWLFGRLILGTERVRWSRDRSYRDHDACAAGGQMIAACSPIRPAIMYAAAVFRRGCAVTALARIKTKDAALQAKISQWDFGYIIETMIPAHPADLEDFWRKGYS